MCINDHFDQFLLDISLALPKCGEWKAFKLDLANFLPFIPGLRLPQGPSGVLGLRGGLPAPGDRRPGPDAPEGRPPHAEHADQARSGTQDLQRHRRDARGVEAELTKGAEKEDPFQARPDARRGARFRRGEQQQRRRRRRSESGDIRRIRPQARC